MATKDASKGKGKGTKVAGMFEIEITNDQLMNEFVPAVVHLCSLNIKNVDILSKFVKAKRAAKALAEEYNETRTALLEQDCIKGEDGKPEQEVIDEQSGRTKYKYETPEDERLALQGVNELLKQKVSFNVQQVKLKSLRNIDGLSGNTIDMVYDLITLD